MVMRMDLQRADETLIQRLYSSMKAIQCSLLNPDAHSQRLQVLPLTVVTPREHGHTLQVPGQQYYF